MPIKQELIEALQDTVDNIVAILNNKELDTSLDIECLQLQNIASLLLAFGETTKTN